MRTRYAQQHLEEAHERRKRRQGTVCFSLFVVCIVLLVVLVVVLN